MVKNVKNVKQTNCLQRCKQYKLEIMTKQKLEYEIAILRDIRSKKGWTQKEADKHQFLIDELEIRFPNSKYVDTTLNKHENVNGFIDGVVCCGSLEELDIRWAYLEDRTKCIPHIMNIQKDKEFRVNFCPVC